MPLVTKQVTVRFFLIEPMGNPLKFSSGEYPLDQVLTHLGRLDPAADSYRIKEDLFGGETLCLLHDGDHGMVLGAYYKDLLSLPQTEYKGELAQLILRDGEALVEVSVNHPERLRDAMGSVGHHLVGLIVKGLFALWASAVLFASAVGLSSASSLQVALFGFSAVLALGALIRSGSLLALLLRAFMPTPPPPPQRSGAPIVLDGPDPGGYEVRRADIRGEL